MSEPIDPNNPNVSPFNQSVHNEQRSSQQIGIPQDQARGMRGKLIESLLQLVVQAITGIFVPGGLGSAFDQLKAWADDIGDSIANIPVIGPFIEWLASLFGVDIGEVGDPDFSPSAVWENVVNAFINPLGFFANLVGGLIPGLQIPSFDASKIVSGFFNNGLIPGLTKLIDDVFGGFTGLFGTGWSNTDAAAAIAAQAQIAASNAAAISALEAKINAANDTISPIDDFEFNANDLGVKWERRSLQSNAGAPGQWVTDGHNAVWSPGGTVRQTTINRYIGSDGKFSQSDYQIVGIVLESTMQGTDFFFEESFNDVMARMNDQKNCYVLARFGRDSVRIFGVINDVAVQIGPTTPIPLPVTGTGLYLAAGTVDGINVYQAMVNNQVFLEVRDISNRVRVGSAYHSWGFGSYVGIRAGSQSLPGGVRAWAASDPQASTEGGGGTGGGFYLTPNSVDPRIYDATTTPGFKLSEDPVNPRKWVTGANGLLIAADPTDTRIYRTI